MKITIQLLGQARQLASDPAFEIELPDGASVHEALPAILERGAPGLRTLLADDDGKLRPSVMAILHEETIDPGATGLLNEGDQLSLLPPMSGG